MLRKVTFKLDARFHILTVLDTTQTSMMSIALAGPFRRVDCFMSFIPLRHLSRSIVLCRLYRLDIYLGPLFYVVYTA